ncbi:Zinc finger ccch domain-containing protein [Thalictrum thalictroides]|uniref:Zinc finger ccch domain-containing protein n=1 Tax=Thalictrum thalictroides TaxID=46969 RepID=A0A7J6V4V0_THATH|nr:Zinc finger ccch domain-containing protein [Thalictrum thalictroides]
MGGEEEEAVVAIALGFPPYQRSLLKSKTYEAFVKISSLFYQISPKSGKESQEKEQACISENSVENELDNENVVEKREAGSGREQREKAGDMIKDLDIEEGEISDDTAEIIISDDQENHSVEFPERRVEEGPIFGDFIEEGEFPATCTEQNRIHEKDILSTSSIGEMSNFIDNIGLNVVKGKKFEEWSSENLIRGSPQLDRRKNNGGITMDTLGHSGAASERVMADIEGKKASVKDIEVGVKRKRVVTKERKERKKAKRRIKRVQKDRQEGVKRLNLRRNVKEKPKPKLPCKHHLKGKCQQGDSCKFSHDFTPLTKSEPCRFFACNKCLKGDDCPYDHELFKYQCDSYKSKGFCPRGDTCLFSHKMPLPRLESDANKKALENFSIQPLKGSTYQQTLNMSKNMTRRTPASLGSITRHPGQKAEEMKPAAQAPKGISFLLFDKDPSADSSKQQKSNLPPIGDNGVAICSIQHGAPQKLHNSNEMLVRPQSKMMAEGQDKNINSAHKAPTSQIIRTMDQSVQSTASHGNFPTVSSILQEFLFNGH